MKSLFSGVSTSLITPFREGNLDFESLERLLEAQKKGGITTLVVAGTTGEAPALTYDEFLALCKFVRAHWSGNLIAGCGANCTARAAELAELAKSAGADALLAVTPYYNKATRAGLAEHYRALAACGLPVIVYHVPARTGYRLSLDDFRALAKVPGVCGVKECSGDLGFLQSMVLEFSDRWGIWTGNDTEILAAMRLGADGVISVASNLIPAEIRALTALSGECDLPHARERAAALYSTLATKIQSLFWEVNPVPVKFLAAEQGLCAPEYRLPLTPPAPETAERLQKVWGEEKNKVVKLDNAKK